MHQKDRFIQRSDSWFEAEFSKTGEERFPNHEIRTANRDFTLPAGGKFWVHRAKFRFEMRRITGGGQRANTSNRVSITRGRETGRTSETVSDQQGWGRAEGTDKLDGRFQVIAISLKGGPRKVSTALT